ncbi:MAG: ABC transporter permease DevC [Pirellulales bacterium]|nr:ABC transporter permease DevC [Pirellulales bacterium]
MLRRTPLAWKNLTHDPRRLLIAAVGIGFAVLLMTTQLGFLNAMSDSNVELLVKLRADIVLRSGSRYTLAQRKGFPRRRLAQAAAVPGVVVALPLYLEQNLSVWRNPADGIDRAIRVIGVDLDQELLELDWQPEVRDALRRPFTLASDRRSKREFGNLAPGAVSELSGQRAEIVGQFTLGTDFLADGSLLTNQDNFERYFPLRNPDGETLDDVDLGVVRVAADADPDEVLARLRHILPADVEALSKDAIVAGEREFWRKSTPIGFVFGLGTAMGFLVGVIICYQVLYTDIADHMAEFATLKAMGYRARYFLQLVLEESVLLSLFGFLPGILVSLAVFGWLGDWTGLLMRLTPPRMATVLALTMLMCMASGMLALRKLMAADPAELFR